MNKLNKNYSILEAFGLGKGATTYVLRKEEKRRIGRQANISFQEKSIERGNFAGA